MVGLSVDGLVSGLDTTNLVRQLMQLERQPQVRLQSKLTKANSLVSTYQTLNTRVLALKNAAEALSKPDGLQATKATSSVPSAATVTASATAATGSLSFNVEQLAAAHTSISQGSVVGTDAIVATGDVTITVDGTAHNIALGASGTATLDELVTLINNSGSGVRATAVQVEPDTYRLQLSSESTGAASTFTIAPTDPADTEALAALRGTAAAGEEFGVVTQGRDSLIQVGDATTGYTVSRPTNTLTDVLPGVTINLVKADPATTVTVDVTSDPAAVADKLGKLVEAVNSVFTYMKLQGSYNPETKNAGPLLGDATARQVQTSLYRAIGTLGDGETLSQVGLSITKEGLLSVDKAAFTKAFEADPAAVTTFFADGGYASRLVDMAKAATDPSDPAAGTKGSITAAIDGRKDAARGLTTQIESWDNRLAVREKALRRQYAALESALGTLNNQSQWLAGQLAGLPNFNNR